MRKSLEALIKDGFILVFNRDDLDVVKTAEALMAAGINNMEVTCRISNPLAKIQRLKKELPDFVVGAASLVDNADFINSYNAQHADDPLPTVSEVVDVGIDYLVSAVNFSAETYKKYVGKLPIIPGCGTANEIMTQFALGASFVKIFPANMLGGPAFVKAIDPALHKIISIVPTGGTNAENIPAYIDAGILVLGGSFSAIEKRTFNRIVTEQDYTSLADELTKIKFIIDNARSKKWGNLDFSLVEEVSRVTGRRFS